MLVHKLSVGTASLTEGLMTISGILGYHTTGNPGKLYPENIGNWDCLEDSKVCPPKKLKSYSTLKCIDLLVGNIVYIKD